MAVGYIFFKSHVYKMTPKIYGGGFYSWNRSYDDSRVSHSHFPHPPNLWQTAQGSCLALIAWLRGALWFCVVLSYFSKIAFFYRIARDA